MSLLAFLEFGGEAVVRGILSQLDETSRRGAGGISVLAEGLVRSKLEAKGYGRFNLTDAEIRDVARQANRSLNAAARLERGEAVGRGGATGVPVFPSSSPGEITYTVKITYRNPDGTTSDAIVEVKSNRELGRAEVRENALEAAADRRDIVSDPASVIGTGRQVSNVQVISIYSGEVIRP